MGPPGRLGSPKSRSMPRPFRIPGRAHLRRAPGRAEACAGARRTSKEREPIGARMSIGLARLLPLLLHSSARSLRAAAAAPPARNGGVAVHIPRAARGSVKGEIPLVFLATALAGSLDATECYGPLIEALVSQGAAVWPITPPAATGGGGPPSPTLADIERAEAKTGLRFSRRIAVGHSSGTSLARACAPASRLVVIDPVETLANGGAHEGTRAQRARLQCSAALRASPRIEPHRGDDRSGGADPPSATIMEIDVAIYTGDGARARAPARLAYRLVDARFADLLGPNEQHALNGEFRDTRPIVRWIATMILSDPRPR